MSINPQSEPPSNRHRSGESAGDGELPDAGNLDAVANPYRSDAPDAPDATLDPHQQTSATRDAKKTSWRRPGLWVAATSVLLIFIAQAAKPWLDNQYMNLLSYLLGLIAFLAVAIWALRCQAPLWARWLPAGGGLASVAIFLGCNQFVGVTGEMVPIFESRFAARPEAAAAGAGTADLRSVSASDFPGFLGVHRDGVVQRREFALDWTGAKELWRQPVGAAWSGFAIVGQYAVTLEQRGEGEQGQQWVTCYRIPDGKLVWSHASPGAHYHVLGGTGPRSTPTIDQGRVYAQTALGNVVCLDGRDGSVVWELDLFKLAGLTQAEAELAVTWGRAGSPLVVSAAAGPLVVVPYGGPRDPGQANSPIGSLIALDGLTGEVRWIGGTNQISYASPIEATLDGQRQIVSVNESTVTGHAVDDGSVLWEADWPGSSSGGANCSDPVVYGDDGILLGKGYGGGSRLLRINLAVPAEERVEVEWVDGRMLKTKFTNAVLDGDLAYALSDGTLECVDLRIPKKLWRQPRGSRYGQGQVLRVEDVLVVQTEPGDVALVACQSEEFKEWSRLDALSDNTWNYPAVAGRYLLVRSSREAVAYELPAREKP